MLTIYSELPNTPNTPNPSTVAMLLRLRLRLAASGNFVFAPMVTLCLHHSV